MKVSELEGAELDRWVERAQGVDIGGNPIPYCSNWKYGGPIIERENISIYWVEECDSWVGSMWVNAKGIDYYSPTPLIAAMRCFVASKFGDEVSE